MDKFTKDIVEIVLELLKNTTDICEEGKYDGEKTRQVLRDTYKFIEKDFKL